MMRALLVKLAVLILLSACGGGGASEAIASAGGAAKVAEINARLLVLETDISTKVLKPLCTSDAQCRALPLGARACGGPDRYQAYSTQVSDRADLERLSAEHQRLSAQRNELEGTMGICSVLPVPAARCESLSCVVR